MSSFADICILIFTGSGERWWYGGGRSLLYRTDHGTHRLLRAACDREDSHL